VGKNGRDIFGGRWKECESRGAMVLLKPVCIVFEESVVVCDDRTWRKVVLKKGNVVWGELGKSRVTFCGGAGEMMSDAS
jgi:hypothetical protein